MVIYSNIKVDASIYSDRIQHGLLTERNVSQDARTWQEGDNGMSKENMAGTRKLRQRRDGCGWKGKALGLGLECGGVYVV